MLKKLVLLTTLPMAAFAFDSGPITRENRLILYSESGPIDSFEFTLAPQSMVQDTYNQTFEPYSVYPMKAWHGLTSNFYRYTRWDENMGYMTYYKAIITVWLPRKNNSKVADWAKVQQTAVMNGNNNGKVYASVAGSSVASAPEQLNFAFMGQLRIGNYICDNVIIAQGHSRAASSNNWWIYSNYWPKNADGTPKKFAYHKNRIKCVSGDEEKLFRVKPYAFPNVFRLSPVHA
ncbi:hypothetical protein Lgee_1099 [Legionella geestiana]|uniref:Uncharacterized protein n=3 Tax=Legionella geestiana TaxID=45065 RepID=A0A0W0TWR8_9GAMM|nr:hypothetical protein [Legionella geestiana]KTD00101.1 hypothetical protein Lgee_1099 [Legionella geestiana]QDQ38913.1 hypothetical protein E3226_000100 [Legionella geestiana]STX53986.1 Uncharacterised protein [Legionella geestiana]